MSVDYRNAGGLPGRPPSQGDSLADILERVLDKGIVIAGDIQINLLDIELLTIKLRLIVASVDKAKEMGIDWWESDPALNAASSRLALENRNLRERLDRLERGLAPPAAGAEHPPESPADPPREEKDA
ncbi:MAG: sle [Solirubrobacterales bacterium]|nr:sle [Microbacteriaceae bacterium]MCW3015214.1 sle [Solirubrobacterales bacterium]